MENDHETVEESESLPDLEEITESDELPGVYVPGEDDSSTPSILTAEKRHEILGKLAEFELLLSDMTLMQENFTLAILRDPSSMTNAARTAGYAGDTYTLRAYATKLIRLPKIAAAIALGQQLREDRTMVTSDRTLNELAIIAFSNIGDYTVRPGTNEVSVKDGVPEYALRAVSQAEFVTTVFESSAGDVTTTYKVKIKLWSKTDALRMLAMYQKLLSDGGNTTIIDKSQHQHNTWQFGGRSIKL